MQYGIENTVSLTQVAQTTHLDGDITENKGPVNKKQDNSIEEQNWKAPTLEENWKYAVNRVVHQV